MSDTMNDCSNNDRGVGITTANDDNLKDGQQGAMVGPGGPPHNAAVQAELERILSQSPELAECDIEVVAKLRDDQLPLVAGSAYYFSGVVMGAALALGKKPEDLLTQLRRPDGTPVIERARGEREDLIADCRVIGARDAALKDYEDSVVVEVGGMQWMRRIDEALVMATEAGIAVELLPEVVEKDIARMIASGEVADDLECVAAYRQGWVASLRAQLSFSKRDQHAPRRAEPVHPLPEKRDE